MKTVTQVKDLITELNTLGTVISYPTESVFGLGCSFDNLEAQKAIIRLKGRQQDQGFVLLSSNLEQLENIVDFNKLSNNINLLKQLVSFANLNNKQSFSKYLDDLVTSEYTSDNKYDYNFLKFKYFLNNKIRKQISSYELEKEVLLLGHDYLVELLKQAKNSCANPTLTDQLSILLESILLNIVKHLSIKVPISFILPAQNNSNLDLIKGKFSTIAVRFIKLPLLKELISIVNKPIISTSANVHGQSSCRTSQQVYEQLYQRCIDNNIELTILDNPVFGAHKESVLLDIVTGKVLRNFTSLYDESALSYLDDCLIDYKFVNDDVKHQVEQFVGLIKQCYKLALRNLKLIQKIYSY